MVGGPGFDDRGIPGAARSQHRQPSAAGVGGVEAVAVRQVWSEATGGAQTVLESSPSMPRAEVPMFEANEGGSGVGR
jgi:hypothetical protein